MLNLDALFANEKEDYQDILAELRSDRARLIDIREQKEWEQGRFKCATHVPLSDLAQGKGVDILKEIKQSGRKIYLHCRSGNRVKKAQEVLAFYGCTEFKIIPITMMQMLEEGFLLTR